MPGLNRNQYLFIIISTAVLFFMNNIILGSIIPRLPGGSAFGITTMFTIAFISLTIKKFGCIPMIYIIYGLIGTISHLLVNDWSYLLLIMVIALSAAGFDWFLNKFNYRLLNYFIGFPFFIIITEILIFAISYFIKGEKTMPDTDVQTFAISVLMGYSGIILAYLLLKKLPKEKLDRFR